MENSNAQVESEELMDDKKVILAIDDNVTLLDTLQVMLEAKYTFRKTISASNAIHFLNGNNVDVILLDIEMPNISGFDFLKDIRRIPRYMSVPIIIISGVTGKEFFEEARNSSAFDVLTKPVRKETLINVIEKSLASNG